MNDSDSENSVKEIDFSRKSASSSEKFQQAQLNKTQSEDFQIRSKFSDNSDKSVIFSIEKAAFHRSKNKIILENPQAINLGVSKLCNLQEKAETLDKFLYKARENLDYSRELSNKKEEIITLNSRLNQLYIENQSMEEKLLKTDSKLKIITDEYNKGLNRITELEFSNKHLNEEAFSLKQKVYEYSIVNQTQKANIEKFLLENHHLLEKEANFQEYKDKIFEELNAKNKEIYDFLDMRKKMEVLKLEIYKDIQVLEEEKLGTFIEENDFIRLVKLLIKDRMFLKEEIRDKFELQQKMNKLNKCLEIQTTENRIVIEELTIQKRINENLCKIIYIMIKSIFLY